MCSVKSNKTGARIAKAVCLLALLSLLLLCALRTRGRTLEKSSYSDQFGEIRVKEIEARPLSLIGLLGLGEKLYRCEFRRSPGGVLESAVSLQEDSYNAQQIEVSWHSARKAIVSFDQAVFFELEDGVWEKISKRSIEGEATR